MRRIFWACALGMLLLGVALPAGADAAYPGALGKLAWEAFPAGGGTDSEIVVSNADGTAITPVTTNTVDDVDPAWSPDGKKIAFAHFNGTYYEIWTMNADGSGQTAVVQLGKSTTHPTWSPTGNKLAFTYAFSATDDDIWSADSSGLNSNATAFVQDTANEREPAWEPGGSRIAFSKFNSGSGRYDIVFMSYPSGTIAPFLFSAVADFTEPAWSADATKLAFRNGLSASDIFTENLDGTGYGPLPSPAAANERNPAWSPEGKLVAYDYDGGSDTDIFTQPFNFSIRNTIVNPGHDRDPDWQPVTTAQVRPKGASPLYLPLTVAFDDCGAGPTHDPPFLGTTCGPAQASSSELTVGEPQVNGKPANLVGFVRIKTSTPSNGQVTASITDVRCKTLFANGCNVLLGDYTSFVRLGLQFQVTDRATAAGTATTVQLAILSANVPCTATADPNIGSTCQLTTDLNTITPGAVVPGKRASWVLRKVTIYDGASKEFLVPGTFYP
jgi:Tol biopolymer transport system component